MVCCLTQTRRVFRSIKVPLPNPWGNCTFWNYGFMVVSFHPSVCAYPPLLSNLHPFGVPHFVTFCHQGGGELLTRNNTYYHRQNQTKCIISIQKNVHKMEYRWPLFCGDGQPRGLAGRLGDDIKGCLSCKTVTCLLYCRTPVFFKFQAPCVSKSRNFFIRDSSLTGASIETETVFYCIKSMQHRTSGGPQVGRGVLTRHRHCLLPHSNTATNALQWGPPLVQPLSHPPTFGGPHFWSHGLNDAFPSPSAGAHSQCRGLAELLFYPPPLSDSLGVTFVLAPVHHRIRGPPLFS